MDRLGAMPASALLAVFLAASAAHADLICYTYDAEGRLKDATRDDGSQLRYTNDNNDNRTLLERRIGQTATCATPDGAGSGAGEGGGGNSPPVAEDDFGFVWVSSSTIISVLANDTDPDNDPLSVISVTQPAQGSAVITDGGTTVTYYASSIEGEYSFQYTISDGNGGTDTATVWVTVVGGF